jgi:hypothetical protein
MDIMSLQNVQRCLLQILEKPPLFRQLYESPKKIQETFSLTDSELESMLAFERESLEYAMFEASIRHMTFNVPMYTRRVRRVLGKRSVPFFLKYMMLQETINIEWSNHVISYQKFIQSQLDLSKEEDCVIRDISEFEIWLWNNSRNIKSLTAKSESGYLLLPQAKATLLTFSPEVVLTRPLDWGRLVREYEEKHPVLIYVNQSNSFLDIYEIQPWMYEIVSRLCEPLSDKEIESVGLEYGASAEEIQSFVNDLIELKIIAFIEEGKNG